MSTLPSGSERFGVVLTSDSMEMSPLSATLGQLFMRNTFAFSAVAASERNHERIPGSRSCDEISATFVLRSSYAASILLSYQLCSLTRYWLRRLSEDTSMPNWGFYGRRDELEKLRSILGRDRWFFIKITGRRRIGKTALVQQALDRATGRSLYYVQIPDSGEAGVISAVNDALDTFKVPPERYPRRETSPSWPSCSKPWPRTATSSSWTSSSTSTGPRLRGSVLSSRRRRIGCPPGRPESTAAGSSWGQSTPK